MIDSPTGINLDVDKKQIIEFRKSQSVTSRLAEYLTGIRPDNPKMGKLLTDEHYRCRCKYVLPNEELKTSNPEGYELYLRKLMKEQRVVVLDKSEFGTFFEDHPDISAVYFPDRKVMGVDLGNSSESETDRLMRLTKFEHETMHALQDCLFPEMTIEQKEFEAYVAGISVSVLQSQPEPVFNAIRNSLVSWRKQGGEISAEWGNPNWFLKNVDKVVE